MPSEMVTVPKILNHHQDTPTTKVNTLHLKNLKIILIDLNLDHLEVNQIEDLVVYPL